jgi:hypothetical protein
VVYLALKRPRVGLDLRVLDLVCNLPEELLPLFDRVFALLIVGDSEEKYKRAQFKG